MSANFDPNDFQDFEEPSFPEDADVMPPEPSGGPRTPRNRRFIIIALLLVLIFLIALGLGVSAIIDQHQRDLVYQQTVESVYKTNTAVAVSILGTNIAKSWTPTPTATFTPTFTPTPSATPTDTPTGTATPTATIDLAGSQTAQAQTAIAAQTLSANDITSTANAQATLNAIQAMTQTAQAIAAAPTLSFDQMTQTAQALSALSPADLTSTADALNSSLTQTAIAREATVPPVTEVTVAPTSGTPTKVATGKATANPNTGLFDDMGLGAGGGVGSLGIVGLAALALVGVIVMARVLRSRT